MIGALEHLLFRFRGSVLAALAVFTVAMGFCAVEIDLETAFEKHLPLGHPYVDTFLEYKSDLVGVNRVVLALRAREGDIWNVDYFRRLSEATDGLAFLPGIDRRTVTSLWTPNIRTIEITEDGMRADDMIGGDVTLESLDDAEIARIRDRVLRSGLVGRLVSNDFTTAMVAAEALDVSLSGSGAAGASVLELGERLEALREELSDERYDVHLLGFVTMTGFIADGARTVVFFFALAFLLTAVAVYVYSRSWKLTFLPLACSLVSAVWQFGVMALLGYGVDPLAILVPFLVFAIGVSHGIQQVNRIGARLVAGDDEVAAARAAFRGLLVPGSMALATDGIAFLTLILIPIPMVQELGITAAIGIAFKVLSTLVLLPLMASYMDLDGDFVERTRGSREFNERLMSFVAKLAEPAHAARTLAAFALVLGVSAWQGLGRHVGDLQPGATELRPESRYNEDARQIVEKFDLGLDILIVVAETQDQSCIDYETLAYLDRFSWHMQNTPGVLSVMSAPVIAKVINSAWNEGNPAWRSLPRDRYALVQATSSIPSELGVVNADCTLMPVSIFTSDHRAETIAAVMDSAVRFRAENPSDRVVLRLASGNVGIQAATNEALEASETPMMLYAYASIVLLVGFTYRSLRAVLCCAVPLTVATFVGYWFMKELEIGLKVATLPVMVLAVGIGVDYAFYIYNRLQHFVDEGLAVTDAYKRALVDSGNAVVFTAVTLCVGVATWSASPLKFQADMGALLSFMFFVNMVTAVTLLPALAVMLDKLWRHVGKNGKQAKRVKGVKRVKGEKDKSAGASLVVLVGAALALAAPAPVRAEPPDRASSPALVSEQATSSLLLGAAELEGAGRIVAVGDRGHVVLSDDGGESWRQARSVPTRVLLTAVDFVDAKLGWAVGHDGVVIHTRDGGETWQLQHAAPEEDTPLFSVLFRDAQTGMAVGAFGLALQTADAGETWTRFRIGAEDEEELHLNGLLAAADGTRWIAAEYGNVYREEPDGSFTRLETGYAGSFWGGLGLPDGSVVVFGLRGHVFRTRDGGQSFQQREIATDQSIAGGDLDAAGRIVLSGLGGLVARESDSGLEAFTRESRQGGNAVLAVEGGALVFGGGGVERFAFPD